MDPGQNRSYPYSLGKYFCSCESGLAGVLRVLVAIYKLLQPFAALYRLLQVLATIHKLLQLFAIVCKHL
jgi:hypothetical protein